MIYVDLNEEHVRRLSFYLAMEEWVARNMSEPECFFMWQVEPSVIFGRNQDVYSEVNLDYCRQNGIQVYRRKSGGGCVYADLSNVMLAYITTADEAQTTFDHYLKMVVEVLKKMGIAASWTEHNDIMIGDRKHDIMGAKENGLDSIGVLYGYGDEDELREAGATFIAEKPADILKYI